MSPRARLAAFLCLLALLTSAPAGASDLTPERVACLLPWVRDALDRLPGTPLVVASVRSDPRLPPDGDVVDLGSPHDPSLERLAEARATLVVGDSQLHAALAPRLAATGAEVVLMESASVDATFASLGRLAARVGRSEAMTAEVVTARERLAAVALPAPVPVLALFGTPGSFRVISGEAWLGDLLARVGFRNLGAGVSAPSRVPGYVELSDEALAALRPELVLLVVHGDADTIRAAFEDRLAARGLWREPRARIERLDPRLFSANPGLALPDAAQALVALAADSRQASADTETHRR